MTPIGPLRKIGRLCAFFTCFRSTEKMAWDGPNGTRRIFVPTNPDLADILGRTDLNFENCYFLIFWNPTFWISRSPDLQISGFPDPQISKFLNSQISRFPDFQTPPPRTDEPSDPNLTPSLPHPGIKYVARAFAATSVPHPLDPCRAKRFRAVPCQDLGTNISVPRYWYQDHGTKKMVSLRGGEPLKN